MSPPLHRPKLIVQPALPPAVDADAVTQLQRTNVELTKQLQEQADTILVLRRDLAGANARLSDVTGTVTYFVTSGVVVGVAQWLGRRSLPGGLYPRSGQMSPIDQG